MTRCQKLLRLARGIAKKSGNCCYVAGKSLFSATKKSGYWLAKKAGWLAVTVFRGAAKSMSLAKRQARRLFVAIYRIIIPPKFAKSAAYREAESWLQGFKPSDNSEGYDKALQYAWKQYDGATSASETLDKKADNLMRNAGLVAGLLGVAMNALTLQKVIYLVPALITFIASLILSAVACNPTAGATTASVHDLLDDVTEGHSSDAWVAASIHCAIVGRTSLNDWKAARIRWATWAFCIALLCFLIPLWGLYISPWLFS